MEMSDWTKKLRKKFPGIIEKFMGGKISGPKKSNNNIDVVPSVNISDSLKNDFEITFAVPGLSEKDINIEVENNCLVITSNVDEKKEGRCIRREFNYASFNRVFELPENADAGKINASMDKGLLTITIGKKEGIKQKFRKIAVK